LSLLSLEKWYSVRCVLCGARHAVKDLNPWGAVRKIHELGWVAVPKKPLELLCPQCATAGTPQPQA
jgi:hypothetical protein